MIDRHILDRLQANNAVLDSVSERLDALQSLFGSNPEANVVPVADGFFLNPDLSLVTVFQSAETTVSVATFVKAGVPFASHQHAVSLEFVIVIKGSVIFRIDGACRKMTRGECASVPLGSEHSCVSLEPDTVALAICVPPEKAYVLENPKCQTSQEKS